MNQLYTELLPEDPTWDETYPRPQMVRDKWQSLNGEWQMDIGKTCNVPFCLESVLSGVCTSPYGGFTMKRTFTLDDDLQGDLILFHFGAVDEYADVFINGNYLGAHDNGYLPFTYAVPREELVGKENVIRMDIADTTDKKFPYGKQKVNRGGIWYTAITGIWQTIWMEAVPKDYIVKIRTITQNDQVQIHKYLSDGTVEVEEKQIKEPHLWNIDDPYLYYAGTYKQWEAVKKGSDDLTDDWDAVFTGPREAATVIFESSRESFHEEHVNDEPYTG